MSIQKHILEIESGLAKLKDDLHEDYSITMYNNDDCYTGDVCDIAEEMLQKLSQEQIDKVERFCMISEGRYMRFGNFVNNLKLINQSQSHELSKGLVSHTLLALLFIQDDIDNFEPVVLGVLDV